MDDYKFQIVVGDRRTPLSMRMYDEGKDNNLAGATVTFDMFAQDGTQVITDGSCTVQPAIEFTADLDNHYYLAAANGLKDFWEVLASSTTSLPSPLNNSLRYFTRDCTPNNFNLSLSPNSAAKSPESLGTGTHSLAVVGQVLYEWSADDVATAGRYRGWFKVTKSGVSDTFPNNSTGIAIVIASKGSN